MLLGDGASALIVSGEPKSGAIEIIDVYLATDGAYADELGIRRVVQGARDKLAAFETLLAESGVVADACAFVGDDLPDLPVLRRCGFAVAVANAVEEVKAACLAGGVLKSAKGVNLPNTVIQLPSITERDWACADWASAR